MELFAGLLTASFVAQDMNLPVTATYFSETESAALKVASVQFPEAMCLGAVEGITEDTVSRIVAEHSDALFCVVGGPPCQDVSKLNPSRTGAEGSRSGLRAHFQRVYNLFASRAPGSTFGLMECTQMSARDRSYYDAVFGSPPFLLCSRHFAPITRPRLWWCSHSHKLPRNVGSKWSDSNACPELVPSDPCRLLVSQCLLPGWTPCAFLGVRDSSALDSTFNFNCLTTKTARDVPGYKPRGLREASPTALRRWEADAYAQSPYQYAARNCVCIPGGNQAPRRLTPNEEEVLMGFPPNYTLPARELYNKENVRDASHKRQSLLGNSWHVGVVSFIFKLLLVPMLVVQSTALDTLCAHDASPDRHCDVYAALRESCPYLSDRLSRGLDISSLQGPDWAEQNAHQAASNAEGVQLRRQSAASGGRALLPMGLDPLTHFACSASVPSPILEESAVPDDLDFALRVTASLGREARSWRRKQLRVLQLVIARAEEHCIREEFELQRSHTSEQVSSHVNLHVLDMIRYSIMWPDVELVNLASHGGRVVGHVPKTFIYRDANVVPENSPEELLASSIAWVDAIENGPPPTAEVSRVVWEKSEQERLEKGFLRGWFTRDQMNERHGVGGWRPLVRFAIQQGEKWRVIDNGRSSLHNSTSCASERIHTTSTSAGVAALRRLRVHADRPLDGDYRPVFSTQDMTSAYRQIAVMPEQLCFSVVAVYDPHSGSWVYGELCGLPFGVSPAVLEFNRVPAFLVAAARRWLAIPVISFYDDFKILGLHLAGGDEDMMFHKLVALVGYLLDPTKHQPPSASCTFLGTLETYSPDGQTDVLALRPKPGRLEEIISQIKSILTRGTLQPGEAASLRGRLLHIAGVFTSRLGRSHLYAFDSVKDDCNISDELRYCLLFALELFSLQPWRDVSIAGAPARHAVVVSDASYEEDESGVPHSRICYIVYDPTLTVRRGRVFDVPQSFLQRLRVRKNQIALMEALGPILALMFEPEFLSGCVATFWLDNMSSLSGFVQGSSRAADLGSLVFGAHLCLAKRAIRAWWDYVPSASNIADGGSRCGIGDPVAAAAGIQLSQESFPHALHDMVYATPESWSRFWD